MRPRGVTILSVLFISFGILWVATGAFMLLAFEEIKSMYTTIEKQIDNISPEMFEKALKLTSAFMLFSGILSVLIGWGLWNLQNWARIGAIIFSGFGVISGLISSFVQPYFVLEVILNLLVIWYLMRGDVINAFGRRKSIEEEILGDL